jgi:TIR domain
MGYDVFISHSSQDKPVADAVCATLEANRIRCWIAPRDIMPGREWSEAILDGIHACRVMVIIFSSHANASQQVKREVERAVNKGVAIVPFRIEEVYPSGTMEYFMSATHWLDALTAPMERHLEKLAHTVNALLDLDKRIIPPPGADGAEDDDAVPNGRRGGSQDDAPDAARAMPSRSAAAPPAPPLVSAPAVSAPTTAPQPQWNADFLKRLEMDLAAHIGPLAKILVRKSAQAASDVQALCKELAQHIPSEAERQAFLEKSLKIAGSLAVAAPTSCGAAGALETAVVWDAQELDAVEKKLASYIGPLAKVLVRKAAREATGMAELRQNLAQHIEDEDEKAKFLEDSLAPPAGGQPKATQPASRWRWGHAK